MNFNIYLDDETGSRLSEAAKRAGENRNAVIRRAVQEWLERHGRPQWPEAVLGHSGLPHTPAFEDGRKHLRDPSADPLA